MVAGFRKEVEKMPGSKLREGLCGVMVSPGLFDLAGLGSQQDELISWLAKMSKPLPFRCFKNLV